MKRYSKYKDSGIPWLGQIPEHWEVRKMKRILSLVTERGVSPKKLALENIESYTGRYLPTDSIFDGDGVQVHVGDIVYGKLRPYLCKVWLASFACNAIGDFYVFRCNCECSNQFVSYLFRSTSFTGICNASTYGAKMPRVSSDFMLSLPLPLPPLSEQVAIVSYLDRKVSELDSFVSKQETQISYLKELKQATIAKAVTRGIDPSVALKDSGIPWLGQIPEHWEKLRCKDILKESKEQVGDRSVDYTLLSLTTNGVIVRDLSEGKGKFPKDFDSYKIVQPNQLVFCLFDVDETPRTVGLVQQRGMLTGAYDVFSVRNANVYYLYYYFMALDDRKALKPLYKGLRKVIPLPVFMSMSLPLPPLSEQAAIVSYLDEKLGAIDRLIAASEEAIARVRELKQTLIADVVTGRICVQPS